MAELNITTNKTPHIIKVDGIELRFKPEVTGAEFVQAYAGIREAQKTVSAAGEDADPEAVEAVAEALRESLTSLMLPESREAFAKVPLLANHHYVSMLEFLSAEYGKGASDRPTGRPGGSASSRRSPGTPSKAS